MPPVLTGQSPTAGPPGPQVTCSRLHPEQTQACTDSSGRDTNQTTERTSVFFKTPGQQNRRELNLEKAMHHSVRQTRPFRDGEHTHSRPGNLRHRGTPSIHTDEVRRQTEEAARSRAQKTGGRLPCASQSVPCDSAATQQWKHGPTDHTTEHEATRPAPAGARVHS